MTTTVYPNGQVLSSTALTPTQIQELIQSITYGMIGLATPPPSSWQPVQVDWQTTGQPFVQTPQQDVCYISCVPQEEDYNKLRNLTSAGTSPVVQTWVWTRAWRVAWCLYGPNSTDRARMIWTALFIDWVTDQLSLSNLYPVSDYPEPTRTPEEINKQWFERADFSVLMYEQVTETIEYGPVRSVEVKLYDGSPADPVADITVST